MKLNISLPKNIFLTSLAVLLSLLSNAQETLVQSIFFDTDQSVLTVEGQKKIIHWCDSIKDLNVLSVEIEGHTDSRANQEYNDALSSRRASVVYAAFKKEGIDPEIMYQSFFGENKPVGDNTSSFGRRNNRRVDVKITFDSSTLIDKIEVEPIEQNKNQSGIDELFELLAAPADTFCISSTKDTVVIASGGTIIYVEENSFNIVDPTGCIELIVKERTKISEIIRDNLSTVTTDGQVMVSQIMFNIEASCNGEAIGMNKDFTIYSPTDTILPEMKLFNGITSQDGHVEWIGPGSSLNELSNTALIGDTLRNDFTPCRFFFCRIGNLFRKDRVEIIPFLESDGSDSNGFNPYKAIEENRMDSVSTEDLQYYVYNRRLGWTNLDWLSKISNPIRFKVYYEPDANTVFRIIFKNQRSIVPLKTSLHNYYYPNLPKNRSAMLVGLSYIDKKAYLAIEKIKIKTDGIRDVEFVEYTIPELIEKLKEIDLY